MIFSDATRAVNDRPFLLSFNGGPIVSDLSSVGKWRVGIGVLFFVLGGGILLAGKIPFLGRLPGDIRVERPGFSFYFPFASCLLASILVSAILWLVSKFI